RTRVMSLRGKDPRALVRAGDDSHTHLMRESCRADVSVDEESRFCCSCHVRARQFVGTVLKDSAVSALAVKGGPRSGQRLGLRAREEAVDLVVQRPFISHKLAGELARALEQLAVGSQPREAELGEARLTLAQQLSLAAQLALLLRPPEP